MMGGIEQVSRIEICGGIASGKTTLAGVMASSSFSVLYEQFRENPFWKAFYEDPDRFSFETEITFLLQHYHQIKRSIKGNSLIVCDFSLLLDAAYAENNLKEKKYSVFFEVFDHVIRELGLPDLLVHLECDAGAELERIRGRARSEEASITIEYLDDVNRAVREQVTKYKNIPTIVINSTELDFAHDLSTADNVKSMIFEKVGALTR